MKIALIMLTYNRRAYLERTLKNYERQIGGDERFQILLYNNGSSDTTRDYLDSYKGSLNLTIIHADKNSGVAGGTCAVLEEKCFRKGYDFIARVDDDELLADGWDQVFSYWAGFENKGAVVVGFQRKNLTDYFEGYKWIARNPDYNIPFYVGPFECYRSDMAPGFQLSTEKWWKFFLPRLTDYGYLYGGWDHSLMEALLEHRRCCLVIWNYVSEHIQDPSDYKDLESLKQGEIKKVMDTIVQKEKEKKQKVVERLRKIEQNPTPESLAMVKELRASLRTWDRR